MQTFRFRLERVLEWQRTKCELEEFELKRLYGSLEKINTAVARLEAERIRLELDTLSAESLTGMDLAALAGYRHRLRSEEERLAAERQQCQRHLAEQRARWMEARRRTELLEKLKSRRRAEFEYAANREAESFAAETHLAQWGAKRRRAAR